jgi:gliding motility-associated-like protein
MTLHITAWPMVVAGTDQTVCANNNLLQLSGSVSGSSTSGKWTTSGNGLFLPNDSAFNAQYQPDSADIADGNLMIYLQSTNACAITDSFALNITPAPIVDAGIDLYYCGDEVTAQLSGSVSLGASTGQWTSLGSGSFTPDDENMNAQYVPSEQDTAAGSVILVLTSTNNNLCLAVSDTVKVNYVPAPVLDAGPDMDVCANYWVELDGTLTGGSGQGQWTSNGSGMFVAEPPGLDVIYGFSNEDTTAGALEFYLNMIGGGNCEADADTMLVTIIPAPQVYAGISQTVCAFNDTIYLNGSVSGPTTSGKWSTDGTGQFLPADTVLDAYYIPGQLDRDSGFVYLTLTSTDNQLCLEESRYIKITITPAPDVDAGANQVICTSQSATINGSISGGASTGFWSSLGTGSFLHADTVLGNTYIPSADDTTAGTVSLLLTSTNNGNCLVTSDTLVLTIVPTPNVYAGADVIVCANNAEIQLQGEVTGSSTTGVWSSSGNGVFTPDTTNLNATYEPGSDDIAAGLTYLVLTSTNGCAQSDTLVATLTPAPVVNAGFDQIICQGTTSVFLNGSITGGSSTGIWSTLGSGTFSPADTIMNGVYALGISDSIQGGVRLILTSTNNGTCLPEADTMLVRITTIPTVFAGDDQIVCANDTVQLLGSISGGSGTGIWTSTGLGFFHTSDTLLDGMYVFSPQDTAYGSVTLILSSTNACINKSDTVEIAITPAPTVFAYTDNTVCENNPEIIVNAGFALADGVIWESLFEGTFGPYDTLLSPTYTLSQQDIDSGFAVLIVQTTGNGTCNPAIDTLVINILPKPDVNAGNDQFLCAEQINAQLSGSVSGVTSQGAWSSSGSGTFQPNANTLNAVYIPSAQDTTDGEVTLVLASVNNGACMPEYDTLVLYWLGVPDVFAGNDTSYCAYTDSIALNATVNGAPGGYWTSLGDGIFTPADSLLTAWYIPGSDDIDSGAVSLIFHSAGGCDDASDTMVVTLRSSAQAAFTHNAACNVTDIQFTDQSTATGGGSITSWEWYFGGAPPLTTQNPSLNLTPGNYSVKLVVNTAANCPDSITKTIHVRTLDADFVWNGHCLGDTIVFTDSSAVANDTIISWSWSFGNGEEDTLQNPSVWYDSGGNYTAKLIIETASGCADSLEQTLTIGGISASFTHSGQCVGDSITLTGSIDVPDDTLSSFLWYFGDGTSSSSSLQTIHQYADTGTYLVSLVVEATSGCNDSVSDYLSIRPVPVASFTYDPSEPKINIPVQFTSTSTNSSIWQWSFGYNNAVAEGQTTTYTYELVDVYTVTLIVQNEYGCKDTISQQLNVTGAFPPAVPTAFTPNDDSKNSILYVRGGPFAALEFNVYNEWGKKVFTSTDQTIGWDGTFKGVKQPVGVYVYSVYAKTLEGEEYKIFGDVTLIR